jgi:hypothetical protein
MLRLHMIIEHCVLGTIVLGALAPSVGWGQPIIIDPANSGQLGEQRGHTAPRQHGGVAARPPAHSSASTLSWHAGYRPGRAVTAAPGVGTAVPTRALPKLTQRAMTAAHFTPNSPGPNTVAGVSGNAVGRHASVSAAVGGRATYDAKKAAVISGSAMRRKF